MKTIKNYTPFQFQYASILQHIENVQNNNGACIFDETGLGKTITAATIAINLTSGPILIVSPLANKDSWVQVLQHIDNKYTICTSTKIPEGVYSFVIVDEAHNFKSIKTKSYLALFKIIKLAQCQVLLLSATPFQNKLLELRTMVSLINFHTNTPAFVLLGLLFNSIKDTEKTLDNLARYKGDIETSGFAYRDINVKVENEFKLDFYMKMLAGVFATFSHRNTRVDIEENYKTDVELMGRFPKKHTKLITYGNEEAFKKCFWKTISILNECPLVMQNIYNYHPTKMKGQQLSMGGIMRSFLLKRLDSSVYAFKKSLQNAYDKLIDIENQKGKEVLEIDGEEVPIMPEFWEDYPRDCALFRELILLWRNETDSIKVDLLFKEYNGQKCVVFTEYRDTLEMLLAEAQKRGIKGVFGFSGDSHEKDLERVRMNFDANQEHNIKDITWLITTDVLAEGVNLHVSKELIHFDQKWNPSRTVQRNGRIDRILRTGVVGDITITSFGVDSVIENILELEKTVNKKQYLSEIFLAHLKKPTFYTINEFEHNRVLFYPDYDETLAMNAYRTYAGDIMLKSTFFASRSGNLNIVSYFNPTEYRCEIMTRPSRTESISRRSHVFKNLLEPSSYLYHDTYDELLRIKCKSIPVETSFIETVNEFITEYKLENRTPLESCIVWTKDHAFMSWH